MTGMPPGWSWRKASDSANNDSCVMIGYGRTGEPIAVGDSKHPGGPILEFTPDAIRALIARSSQQ